MINQIKNNEYNSFVGANAQSLIPSPYKTFAGGPQQGSAMGDKNLGLIMTRHGPGNYFAHIMRAAFDPVYNRENTLAQPEQVKPATRFPLAEEQRPHDSSENKAMIDFSGGSYKASKVNPFENTAIIAKGNQNEKPKNSYERYSKYQRYNREIGRASCRERL